MAADPRDVDPIVNQIRPLLAGQPPEIQGGVIADLFAIFLAGHPPALREEILQETVRTTRLLIKPNEEMLFEQRGSKPPGWEKQ